MNEVGSASSADGVDAVDLFWRPGCGFCARLERKLEPTGIPIRRHNIWESDDAAAYVRSVANGNETVPTVRIGDRAMVNPPAAAVVDALREVAPELVPEGAVAPKGPVSRAVDRLRGGG